jgi:hypothetical protein
MRTEEIRPDIAILIEFCLNRTKCFNPSLLDTLGRLSCVSAGLGLRGSSLPGWKFLCAVGKTSLVRLDVNNFGRTSSVGFVGGFVPEDLATVHESSLVILSAVDEIGVVKSELNCTVDNVISSLNTKHKRMICLKVSNRVIFYQKNWGIAYLDCQPKSKELARCSLIKERLAGKY